MNRPEMAEIEALVTLAKDAEAFAPGFSVHLREWKSQLDELRCADNIDALGKDRALDDLAIGLRAAWLGYVHQVCGGYLMSPPHEQPKFLPSGTSIQYDYDRSSRPDILEARGAANIATPAGWDAMCMMFSSGMSALSTLIQVCALHLGGANPATTPSLAMFGGYFETWRLLDTYRGPQLKVEFFSESQKFAGSIAQGGTDVVLIEPLAYDWNMAAFDLDSFADAWRRAGERRPKVVFVDPSLTADLFNIGDLISAFGDTLPWLVGFVRSGLKLDQQGLELANVGIAELFTPSGPASPVEFGPLRERLTANRSVMGTGLSVLETAALDSPWFLNREKAHAYSRKVFANNRRLAMAVKSDGGIFSRIAHPALHDDDRPWAEAPFVVYHLREDTVVDHGKLVAILAYEARARGLNFKLGSSFGFRGHRFEVIRPLVHIREHGDHAGLLKIAMGSHDGPSVGAIIELMQEISNYPDWNALRKAYEHVPAYVKGGFGIYIPRPPRP